MTRCIDLNSDLGEGVGDDDALLQIVTSANVACGLHAGEPAAIARTVGAAAARGVRIGAQVSYPDRDGFGRRPMDLPAGDLTAIVLYQLGGLDALCRAAGSRVTYVRPHGALYNRILTDPAQAGAVVDALTRYDRGLVLLTLPDSAAAVAAAAAGVRVVAEGFADRAYTESGHLRPRDEPGAVLDSAEAVATQALALVEGGRVASICVHGDTPGAVTLARAVRRALESVGVPIAAFT